MAASLLDPGAHISISESSFYVFSTIDGEFNSRYRWVFLLFAPNPLAANSA